MTLVLLGVVLLSLGLLAVASIREEPAPIAADAPKEATPAPVVQARPVIEPLPREEEPAPEPEPPRTKRPASKRPPQEPERAAAPTSELERLLAAVRADPEDSEQLQALGAKLREEARTLADERAKNSIERCATTSVVAGDLEALAACVQRLRAAQLR
jgi:hypothetical protein